MFESNLPDWYRTAGLEPDAEAIPKRVAAIVNFAADARQVILLAQLFYGAGEPSADFLASLRAVFRKEDNLFSNHGNEVELAVLAGAKLVQEMYSPSSKVSELAALAVACTSCQGLRNNPVIPEIPEIAFTQLAQQAASRARVYAERRAPLQPAEPASVSMLVDMAKMQSEIRIVMEEANILWWLFAEHSRDEKRRWEDVDFPGGFVRIGKELADLTEILPGPPATAAFLDRVCRLANNKLPQTVPLREAVDGLEPDWKKRQLYEKSYVEELGHLTPLLNAVRFSLLAPADGGWTALFSKSTQIDPQSALAPQKISFQAYLECLLRRAWNEASLIE